MLSAVGSQLTVAELAERTQSGMRTIRRDLDLLKEVGFPLTEVVGLRGRKHWQLQAEGGVNQLRITLEEAAALYLGRQFLQPLAGTYFFQGSESVFRKIKATLGASAIAYLQKLASNFYYKINGMADYTTKGEIIDDLLRAMEDRRLTVVSYQSLRSTEPYTHYDLHPYAFTWHKNALYLIARSLDHQAIRTFKVDRILEVETQQLQFQRPGDFDIQNYHEGAFGIFHSDAPLQQVKVRFSHRVARIVSEKQFHASQNLKVQKGGYVEASYQLNTLEEFESFVLSFGPLAEVIEPLELRARIANSLRTAAELYSPHPSLLQQKQNRPDVRNRF